MGWSGIFFPSRNWAAYLLSGPYHLNGTCIQLPCSKTSTYTLPWVACDAYAHAITLSGNANSINFFYPRLEWFMVCILNVKKLWSQWSGSEHLYYIDYELCYYSQNCDHRNSYKDPIHFNKRNCNCVNSLAALPTKSSWYFCIWAKT